MVDPFENDVVIDRWTVGNGQGDAAAATDQIAGFARRYGMDARSAEGLATTLGLLLDGGEGGVEVDVATDGAHLSVRIAWPDGTRAGETAHALCPPQVTLRGLERSMVVEMPLAGAG
jgi:hypothetical protein